MNLILNLNFVFSKSMNFNLNFVFSKSINFNLNFVFSKSMSLILNFVFSKSINLNFKIRKKMNGSNPRQKALVGQNTIS